MKMIRLILILLAFFNISYGKLEILGKIDSFSFIDQNNHRFGSKELIGKPWAAVFVFTSCKGVCPILIQEFKRFGEKENDLEKVVLTVDPKIDSSQKFKSYAESLGLLKNDWHFLTEKKETLDKVYKEQFLIGNTNGSHIEKIILVDKKGIIRGYYSLKDQEKELEQDLKILLKEN